MISRDTLYTERLSVNIYGVNSVNSLIDMVSIVLITRNILVLITRNILVVRFVIKMLR
jgi:hypothetical protein